MLAEQIPSFGERHGPEGTAFTERMRQLVNDTPSGRVSCRRIECRVCDISPEGCQPLSEGWHVSGSDWRLDRWLDGWLDRRLDWLLDKGFP